MQIKMLFIDLFTLNNTCTFWDAMDWKFLNVLEEKNTYRDYKISKNEFLF
jgi:hypothetical protein